MGHQNYFNQILLQLSTVFELIYWTAYLQLIKTHVLIIIVQWTLIIKRSDVTQSSHYKVILLDSVSTRSAINHKMDINRRSMENLVLQKNCDYSQPFERHCETGPWSQLLIFLCVCTLIQRETWYTRIIFIVFRSPL